MTLGGHVFMIIISAILVFSGYDLLPIDFENLPLEVNDEPWRPRDLAWTAREEYDGYYSRTPTANYREKNYPRADVFLYYDAQGNNAFTKASLQKIASIENELSSIPKYQSTYCQLGGSGSCQKPVSVIRFFDGSFSSISATFNDPNFDNIVAVLYEASTNAQTAGLFRFFLGKNGAVTSTSAYTDVTRSMFQLGYPLQNYKNEEDYEAHIRDWMVEDVKPILVRIREECTQFDFSYLSQMLWLEDVFAQAMKDVLCAVGSICFIFVLILVHTRSLWVSGFAILSIITSFVTANLIYRIVLGFKYIGFFHILTLFIVLGIGADDIFVFYDVWRNTAYESYPSLTHRLSDAYRKSVFSMLFTSITTAVAFFASAISPLLATTSFGVFSGLVIIVNYLSVILYFPTVVVMYHLKFENFQWPCILFCKRNCKCCKICESKETEEEVHSKYESDEHPPAYSEMKTMPSTHNDNSEITLKKEQNRFTTQISVKYPPEPNGELQKPVPNGIANGKPDGYANGNINKGFESEHGMSTPVHNNSKTHPVKDVNNSETKANSSDNKPYKKKQKQKSVLVRFFRNKYSWFVMHPVLRWVVLGVEAIVLAFFIYQASRLEPDNEGVGVVRLLCL